ncbi:MAG: aldehyde dehydrogenase family protein [Thermoplasmata archaeon]|nr:aldehyde dehydrogenase family protein [Thermoplasmata archaeon]
MSGAVPEQIEMFVGGRPTPGSRAERQVLLNPATNTPLTSTAVASADDARAAMEAAESAFRNSGWAGDDGARRAKALSKLARLLEEQTERFALAETLNMGKTLKESKGDIGYVVRTLDYVAGLADKIEGETIPVPGPRLDYTIREPMGVTVHIAPWNYPLLLAIRSVAPALAAGNAVVLKPASLTPVTALLFAALAKEAGVPDGILNVVVGSGREVGEALVTDPRCRSVSFTGSGEVGQRIAELAAHRVVPVTLELGGKSPVIVFPDADLDRAAKGIAFGVFGNAGQMCWAASRLIVAASVRDFLLEKVVAAARAYRLGPGIEPTSDMGPLVSRDQLDRVIGFVDEARDGGARIVVGGTRPEEPELARGNFLRPTIVDGVDSSARIVREEVFGPVLSVLPFESPDEAVRIANDTKYGLFAALWTRDLGTAHTVARQLEAGMVSVNESPNTYPQTPFSGYKESGIGFEQGRNAVEVYTRRKNVLLNLGASKPKKP